MTTEFKITQRAVDESATNIIPAGEVVISTHVGLGKVCVLAQDTAINQDLKAVIPTSDVLRSYLYHWFVSKANVLISNGTGTTVKGVMVEFVKQLEIPLLPLPTQRAIAAELDRICALKRTAEKTVEKLGVLVKARFVEMFGDGQTGTNKFPVRRLDEVCESMSAGNDVPVDYVKTADDRHQVPIYSNGIGNSGLYGYATEARIYKPCVTISARGTIGWACRRMKPFVPIIRLVVAVPRIDLIDVIYLESALRDQCAINTGTTIPQLPVPAARKIRVILPPLPLQREFAAFVAKVEKLEAAAKRAAERLDVLYRAKLQEYFA